MEERDHFLRKARVPNVKRQECLKLFEEGYGYKKTAQLAGLNTRDINAWALGNGSPIFSQGSDRNASDECIPMRALPSG